MYKLYLKVAVLLILLTAWRPFSPIVKEKNITSDFAVIAYYTGNNELIDSFPVEKLTHIIFSFCHLKGNRLDVRNARDTASIQKLVSLKSRNPKLKVILSIGGWGGCEFCSPVFTSDTGRKEFASSAKELMKYFETDGIDLDWEYPVIEGYPGHAYTPDDKTGFTSLVKNLRDTLGSNYEISFAAGGFDYYLQQSIEWNKVMLLVDKVNLMSYDLVSGDSKTTGHHTPLYSGKQQKESIDNAVSYLASIGVPLNKIIIGAAFYAREWDSVAAVNNGQYQSGNFHKFIPYNKFSEFLSADSGFVFYRDKETKAPYAYNAAKNQYATFDDSVSIRDKTEYAMKKGLGGIMFWELSLDKQQDGLLDVIDKSIKQR
jgi:chitinase